MGKGQGREDTVFSGAAWTVGGWGNLEMYLLGIIARACGRGLFSDAFESAMLL